jgi:hypothetical protein
VPQQLRQQEIALHPLADKTLPQILELEEPPFLDPGEAHFQLSHVEDYVRQHGGRTAVVEQHYIDRDFMEEYSVFYSKSLTSYPNSCRRVGFFALDPADLRREFKRILKIRDQKAFEAASIEFSEEHYLGFSVIKPLQGCPVGRTVLRCLPGKARRGYKDLFPCACDYAAHLLGIPLIVRGLAFQQQDLGVSACATTALWSALQRARELEESVAATPAQITMRASQFALPYGRAMPSEGLSVEQMCQAAHSLGHAPYLFRASERFEESRALLYSSVLSGVAPVLILSRFGGESKHAVAVAGMRIKSPHTINKVGGLFDDRSGDLVQLYVHDDRIGPYLQAEIRERRKQVVIHLPSVRDGSWQLSHVLVPMHPKIRLSFAELRGAAIQIVKSAHAHRQWLDVPIESPSVDYRILKAHAYVESLRSEPDVTDSLVENLCKSVAFSRYVACVRIQADDLDPIDVLLDTTSTQKNVGSLAIVQTRNTLPLTAVMAALLGAQFRCQVIS